MQDEPVSPTADAGGPYEINEGESLELDGSESVEIIQKYEWDLNNDGVFDITTQDSRITISCNEMMTYELQVADRETKTPVNNITLRVTNSSDRTSTDSTTLTVLSSHEYVSVDGITLDKENIKITKGDKATVVATITPDNATNTNIIWSSSDESVAIVKDGVITGVGTGTTTITVRSEDGEFTDTVKVIVEQEDNLLLKALIEIIIYTLLGVGLVLLIILILKIFCAIML